MLYKIQKKRQIALLADTFIASYLSAGALSALYYADRLNQLPIGVIGIAAGTVVLPEMASRIAARDEAGHPLRFLEISRDQITCDSGCAYLEEFAADIPENELRTNPEGLRVIFSAGSGEEKTLIVSGGQITAQLAVVEARRNPPQPAAALAAPAASPPSSAHQ